MKFEMTQEEAQIMLNALVKEPYGLVAELINKIQTQAAEQMQKEQPKSFGVSVDVSVPPV